MELQRNVRSFWKVLGLGIVTLGIYLIVYLFKTLRAMENAFAFEPDEIQPQKVRPKLIALLVVAIILALINLGIGISLALEGYTSLPAGFYVWGVISRIIRILFYLVFWVSFVRLIELSQKKVRAIPLKKSTIWTLITIMVVTSFASIAFRPLGYLSIPVGLIFLYIIVREINKIWTESHEIGSS